MQHIWLLMSHEECFLRARGCGGRNRISVLFFLCEQGLAYMSMHLVHFQQ